MNQLTDKTIVVKVDKDQFWITPEQAKILKESIRKNAKFVEVDDMFIQTAFISYIAPANEVDHSQKIKDGHWKCKDCNRWHPKNEKCGCQGGKF